DRTGRNDPRKGGEVPPAERHPTGARASGRALLGCPDHWRYCGYPSPSHLHASWSQNGKVTHKHAYTSICRKKITPRRPTGLHLGEAAVHKQFRSRDVAAVVGCEKHHGLRDLIGCTEPRKPLESVAESSTQVRSSRSEVGGRHLVGSDGDTGSILTTPDWSPRAIREVVTAARFA